ncbi:hypothetical protein E2C01_025723 [Portunus trituberculatus]|uniref:Uncharacterized protein n=1 Tax=Portunus trituberculatus TaxID=210409 RepID=A0A5B7EIQ3_PORTR|nr:hypothetical protein [Portunus trituberculatus]
MRCRCVLKVPSGSAFTGRFVGHSITARRPVMMFVVAVGAWMGTGPVARSEGEGEGLITDNDSRRDRWPVVPPAGIRRGHEPVSSVFSLTAPCYIPDRHQVLVH